MQVGKGEGVAFGEDDRFFDAVVEFADVARPSMCQQGLLRFGCQRIHTAVVAFGIGLHEAFSQRQNLVLALAKWWELQVHRVDAVVQVLTEGAVLYHLRNVAVGSTDEADINRYLFGIADTNDSTVLQHAQEFRLQVQWDIANLIEEKRTAVGLLELTHMVGMCIGESTFDMSKQFALEECFGNSACVHAHHRTVGTRREAVDLVGKDILTRTILARDEDRCIGGSHFLQLFADSGHGRAGAPVHFGRLAIGYGR